MATVTPTTSINIDDQTFEVSEMSDEVKQMIQYLDEWRQDEADQSSQLLKTRAALRDLQNTLLQQIQKDNAPVVEEAPEVFGEPVDEE